MVGSCVGFNDVVVFVTMFRCMLECCGGCYSFVVVVTMLRLLLFCYGVFRVNVCVVIGNELVVGL